jgi:hypothetical protein
MSRNNWNGFCEKYMLKQKEPERGDDSKEIVAV